MDTDRYIEFIDVPMASGNKKKNTEILRNVYNIC